MCFVGDRNRGLGGGWLIGEADEACDAEADRRALAVTGFGDRAQGEVVVLVDVAEVA